MRKIWISDVTMKQSAGEGGFALSFQEGHHLADSIRYLGKMSSGYKVGLIHKKIEEPVLVLGHRADYGCVPSAAAGRYDEHDRLRYGEARTLYAEAFCSR